MEYTCHRIDEHIDAEETAVVRLRDLLKIQATLAELIQFFHQSLHYQNIEDFQEYIGAARSNAAFELMMEAQHNMMWLMLPKHVDALFDEGVFDAPEEFYYYEKII